MIVKKVKPMFTKLVVTMDRYGADELIGGSIINANKTQGTIKEIQKVIAVGTGVRDIKEGDYVMVSPQRYAVKKYKEDSIKADMASLTNEIIGYNIPQIEIDGSTYMFLDMQDIQYVIEEYEEEKPDSGLIHVEPKIIVP